MRSVKKIAGLCCVVLLGCEVADGCLTDLPESSIADHAMDPPVDMAMQSPDLRCACPVGHKCQDGVCIEPNEDDNNCGQPGRKCAADQKCCGGFCNAILDSENCGGICGNMCNGARGYPPACCPRAASPRAGYCTAIDVDGENCGFCGNKCGSGWLCRGGVCRRA